MKSNSQQGGGVVLRPYQEKAIKSWLSWRERGFHSLLLHLATGTGKTHLALELIMRHFHPEKSRSLWIAHTVELLEQAQKSLFKAYPDLRHERFGPFGLKPAGVVQAGNKDHSARIVFASIQTLRNLERLKAYVQHGLPSLIVIDEAHHTIAESYATSLLKTLILYGSECGSDYDEELLGRCYELAVDDERSVSQLVQELDIPFTILGLTATPMRTDRKALDGVFQRIAFSYPLTAAIQQGYLLPIDSVQVLTHIDVSGVGVNSTSGEFNQVQLASLLEAKNWMELVWDALKRHIPALNASALVAMPSVEMALRWAKYATKNRYPTACVSSKFVYHPKLGMQTNGSKKYWELRTKIFDDLRRGEILGLTGYNTFIEGVDLPRVTTLVWGRPTKSETLFTQAVGRVMRTPSGVARILVDGVKNEYVIVFDDGHIERYPASEVPFDTSCTVIDVTTTGTTLMTVGSLWGDEVRKPAEKSKDDEAEFERLTDEIVSLRNTNDRRVSMGNGISVSRRELFSRTYLSFLYDAERGGQSVALNNSQTLFILPPDDLRSQELYDTIDDEVSEDRRAVFGRLSNIYDNFSIWLVTAPLSGGWPQWGSKDAHAYLCELHQSEGEAINASYMYIGALGDGKTILSRKDARWRRDKITFKQLKLFTAVSNQFWSQFVEGKRLGTNEAVPGFLELHPMDAAQIISEDVKARVVSRKDLFKLARRSGIMPPMLPRVLRFTKGYAVDYYRHLTAEMLVHIELKAFEAGEQSRLLVYDDYMRHAIMEGA